MHISKGSFDVDRNIDTTIKGPRCEQDFVFVDNVQRVDLPKCMPLPSFVRLGCIKNTVPIASCNMHFMRRSRRGGYSKEALLAMGRVEHDATSQRSSFRSVANLVGLLVQGRSEILKYIGGDLFNILEYAQTA